MEQEHEENPALVAAKPIESKAAAKTRKKAEKAKEKALLSRMTPAERKEYKIRKKARIRAGKQALVAETERQKAAAAAKKRAAIADKPGFKGRMSRFFFTIGQSGFCQFWRRLWTKCNIYFPNITQFFVFFMLSNGVTVYQMVLTLILQNVLKGTNLVDIAIRFLGPIGRNFNGTNYYLFDYYAGQTNELVQVDGMSVYGKGGLAFFLAFLVPLATAQIINFFVQRRITFKSRTNPWIAAAWYFVAWVLITLISNILLGLYQGPLYTLLVNTWGWGDVGENIAGLVVTFIQSCISFWVFFPIFKIIFKNYGQKDEVSGKTVKKQK